jgi:predicted MPP superfamily phosphohydrolase
MRYRFLGAFLTLVLAILIQLYLSSAAGIWINMALGVLIAAAFFTNFLELIFLVLFSVFILNWQPAISLEIVVFSLLPLSAFFIGKFIPFRPRLSNTIMILLGVPVFYLILGFDFLIARPNIFLLDLLLSLVSGVLAFEVLEAFSGRV